MVAQPAVELLRTRHDMEEPKRRRGRPRMDTKRNGRTEEVKWECSRKERNTEREKVMGKEENKMEKGNKEETSKERNGRGRNGRETERNQERGRGVKEKSKIEETTKNGPKTAEKCPEKLENIKKGRKSEIMKTGRIEKKSEEEEEGRKSRRGRKDAVGGSSILKDPQRISKDDSEDNLDFMEIEKKIFEGMGKCSEEKKVDKNENKRKMGSGRKEVKEGGRRMKEEIRKTTKITPEKPINIKENEERKEMKKRMIKNTTDNIKKEEIAKMMHLKSKNEGIHDKGRRESGEERKMKREEKEEREAIKRGSKRKTEGEVEERKRRREMSVDEGKEYKSGIGGNEERRGREGKGQREKEREEERKGREERRGRRKIREREEKGEVELGEEAEWREERRLREGGEERRVDRRTKEGRALKEQVKKEGRDKKEQKKTDGRTKEAKEREKKGRITSRKDDKGGKKGTKMTKTQKTKPPASAAAAAASDSDQSDWEEVEEEEMDEVQALLSQSSQGDGGGEVGGVQIELDAPDTLWGMRKRKKRRTEEEMIEDYLRKKVNETIRKVALNMHKTHLLCLLAHGRYLNITLGSGTVLGAALSVTPGRAAHPKGRLDLTHLQRLVEWFGKKFPRSKKEIEKDYYETALEDVLVRRFGTGEVRSAKEGVLLFVALCRCIAISTRLVMALQPLSWKPAPGTLIKPSKEGQDSAKEGQSASDKDGKDGKLAPSIPSSSPSSSSSSSRKKKPPNRKMVSSESESSPERRKGRKEEEEEEEVDEEEEEDDDFKCEKVKWRKKSKGRRKSEEKKKGGEERKKKEGLTEWAEVYVEEEERWVSVDVGRMKIHCVAEIEARMPPGSGYVTAFNPDLTLKDVTQRYISSWLSAEKKLRPCSEWWKASLRPFRGIRTHRDKEEEEEMEKALHLQPLPKTIAEYKNHPLYALQRHLLKFEAIYPPDVSPAGFFKGEPVYPRSSVQNLHSRDTWLKEAKSVRVGEEPYKIVKARPKWDRETCQVVKDRPLELFGSWQVEDYEPPVATNGKVPRNEYGNVELYKPSMLPRGCVHIPVAGINKLARKLRIDCAPAMVGFDFHSGFTHPVYEGFVVCEEFKDVLMDAWNQEQEELARRAEEKREKKIYDNWKKLIKGLLVRERVREKYKCSSDEEEEEEEEEGDKKNKKDEKEVKRKIKQSDIDALENTEMKKEDSGDTGGSQDSEENTPSTSRAPLITHHVRNLSIDLTSNVVEMAHKSRQRMMKTKNTAKNTVKKREKKKAGGTGGEKGPAGGVKEEKGTMRGLSDDSEDTDEEVKKEKIRAILNWGTENKNAGPNLSDSDENNDSDDEVHNPSPPFQGFPHNTERRKLSLNRKRRAIKHEESDEEEEEEDVSTSRSTSPEMDLSADEGKRRVSRRSTKRKVQNYKEEEEEDEEGDISLDESDCEDKSYVPEVKKKRN